MGLDFQLLNFSGHFTAAQTLTFDYEFAYPEIIYWPVALTLLIA